MSKKNPFAGSSYKSRITPEYEKTGHKLTVPDESIEIDGPAGDRIMAPVVGVVQLDDGARVIIHYQPLDGELVSHGTVLRTYWRLTEEGWARKGTQVVAKSGGHLWRGASPNHKPGTGRPPKDIRERARRSLDDHMEVLEAIVQGVDPNGEPVAAKDQIAAYATLTRIGFGGEVEEGVETKQRVVGLPALDPPRLPATPVDD